MFGVSQTLCFYLASAESGITALHASSIFVVSVTYDLPKPAANSNDVGANCAN
ncbi:MAG: hypothetical protein KBT35_08400 [Firmicutes bacterium]|nr:hypothetical protein [Candidatus Colivicinus equi]